MSTKKSSRMTEQISGAVSKYISRRKLDTKRSRCVSVAELASRSVVTAAASTGNLCIFSNNGIDYGQTESQYIAFKCWIAESEDHFKPELAQLLYPLFTHLYISLVVSGPGLSPPPGQASPAAKFLFRHRQTFLGNPEFKLFIAQLGEAGTAEDLEQSPTISSFRSAKYSVTLTERTYKYLVRHLETSDSGLVLQILNQEVDIVIGDPLGSGSRQEMRQGAVETGQPDTRTGDGEQEMRRLQEIFRGVREGPGTVPSVALYRLQCDDGLVTSAEADERGEVLGLGCGDSQVRLVSTQPGAWGDQETGGARVRLGCDRGQGGGGRGLMGEDGQARLLRGHSGPVYDLDWIKGGGLLSCSEDTSVRYWDRDSGAGLAVYRGHNYPVWKVKSDDLGMKFVTASLDRTARLWQPEFNHPLRVYRCEYRNNTNYLT